MPELVITRGLPGSGKTTARHAWVREDPEKRVGVSRDDLRQALFNNTSVLGQADERYVTHIHQETVRRHLYEGRSVIDDSTNLRDKVCREWRDLARQAGADFRIHDLRGVPLVTCETRLRQRAINGGREVPLEVVGNMYRRFIQGRNLEAPLGQPDTPTQQAQAQTQTLYVPDTALPAAYIVDIDGTVALHGERSPYDTSRYMEDTPNTPVCELLWQLVRLNTNFVYTSGRSEDFRDVTQTWLDTVAALPAGPLFMRPSGDTRRDDVVKLELFWQYIAPTYNVLAAFDDRDRVVRAWRSIGLCCLQVQDGDF